MRGTGSDRDLAVCLARVSTFEERRQPRPLESPGTLCESQDAVVCTGARPVVLTRDRTLHLAAKPRLTLLELHRVHEHHFAVCE